MERIELNKENANDLPNEEAVYAFYFKRNILVYECIYVGQTDDLKERTLAHLSESEQNIELKKIIKTNIVTLEYELMPYSSEETRLNKETEWINKLNPRCNKMKNEN